MNSKSLIRRDPVDELTECICNSLCRYPYLNITQDELNEKCKSCILNRIESVILAERLESEAEE